MTLADLFAQQQRDIETFKELRDNAWAEMKRTQGQIITAVGGIERLSEDLKKRFELEEQTYRKEWSMYSGQRHKEILAQHDKQRQAITGKEPEQTGQHQTKARNDNSPLSDVQQKKLKNIIAQQQAIRKRNQEKKRNR